MAHYSNPTENAAIGAVDRELRMLRKEANRLKKLKRLNLLTPEEEARARRRFVGIYRRLLSEALGS